MIWTLIAFLLVPPTILTKHLPKRSADLSQDVDSNIARTNNNQYSHYRGPDFGQILNKLDNPKGQYEIIPDEGKIASTKDYLQDFQTDYYLNDDDRIERSVISDRFSTQYIDELDSWLYRPKLDLLLKHPKMTFLVKNPKIGEGRPKKKYLKPYLDTFNNVMTTLSLTLNLYDPKETNKGYMDSREKSYKIDDSYYLPNDNDNHYIFKRSAKTENVMKKRSLSNLQDNIDINTSKHYRGENSGLSLNSDVFALYDGNFTKKPYIDTSIKNSDSNTNISADVKVLVETSIDTNTNASDKTNTLQEGGNKTDDKTKVLRLNRTIDANKVTDIKFVVNLDMSNTSLETTKNTKVNKDENDTKSSSVGIKHHSPTTAVKSEVIVNLAQSSEEGITLNEKVPISRTKQKQAKKLRLLSKKAGSNFIDLTLREKNATNSREKSNSNLSNRRSIDDEYRISPKQLLVKINNIKKIAESGSEVRNQISNEALFKMGYISANVDTLKLSIDKFNVEESSQSEKNSMFQKLDLIKLSMIDLVNFLRIFFYGNKGKTFEESE